MNPLDALEHILALLHRATLDVDQWPVVSAHIDEAVGTVGNVLVVGEGTRADVRIHHFSLLYRGEPAPERAREYAEVYQPIDEGPPRLRERPIGRLVHVPDLYTENELKTSRAYNEGWRARQGQHGLVTRFDGQGGSSVVWGVSDSIRGDWQPEQLRLLEFLAPHIRHFVNVRQTLAEAEALGTGLAGLLDHGGIGVVHLDRGGRILAANGPALDVLRRGDALRDRDGSLHAVLPADDNRLRRLLKRALPGGGDGPPVGGSTTIGRPLLRSRLEVHVHPVDAAQDDLGARRAAALVLVADAQRRAPIDPARLSSLLGLSPSEARVSALLAEGRSVREIAAQTGHKESYVRWLLKQVYGKLGVSGQVALVRQVLAATGLPRG